MNKFAEYIKEYTEGKKVCILGFGREGKSTYRMLTKYCSPSEIAVADINTIDRAANALPADITLISGSGYQECLNEYDIVFKSPGIVLEKHPSLLSCEITSETQLFFSVYREQIIGITGTKGKSTVTSLIYHILKENGKDCRIAGNIGIPVFDIAEDMVEETIVVCELSCHQLEYMTVSPAKAVFLNLYEEHLDHYGTMENYARAKCNIYLHQTADDILWCNTMIKPSGIAPEVITVSMTDHNADVYVENGRVWDSNDDEYVIPVDRIKLLGVHNHYNIAVAWDVCRRYGIEPEQFGEALCTFDPLSHRLEYVDTVNGVRYYDDSISTACATAIEAVRSVPEPGTILIGGMDRGIDYSPLIEFLSGTYINIICMETSGLRVYDTIRSINFNMPERVYYAEHLDEAVKLASQITPEGKSCILSPAAASYGIFKNFEERGDVFKSLVRELKNPEE